MTTGSRRASIGNCRWRGSIARRWPLSLAARWWDEPPRRAAPSRARPGGGPAGVLVGRGVVMNALLTLAMRSAWNRRTTLSLVAFSIALSTLLLLGFERMRTDVRENFSQSVSGTDLIVGARTGAVQLMLYAVFRIGGATNNVRMESLQAIAKHRAVDWVVPLSLGDSHRGYPV